MEIYLSCFWRLGKSKLGCWKSQCLLRTHFLCPHMVAGVRGGSFHEGTNPCHGGPTLMPWSFPMAPPPNTNTVGLRSQCMTFEKKNIYSIACYHRWGCLKNRNQFSYGSWGYRFKVWAGFSWDLSPWLLTASTLLCCHMGFPLFTCNLCFCYFFLSFYWNIVDLLHCVNFFVQQSDSPIHIYAFFSIMVYLRVLNTASCAIP